VKEWVAPLRLLITVGWYVALSLMVPVGVGYWLDLPQMFNRAPLFTLLGLGLGTIIAFAGLIRMLLRYRAEQEDMKKTEGGKDLRGRR
jgi:F0F1-type ATP synthase assembly protein I